MWTALAVICLGVLLDVWRTMGDINTPSFRIWFQNSAYHRVKVGMTQRQVLATLGKPDSEYVNPVYHCGAMYGARR